MEALHPHLESSTEVTDFEDSSRTMPLGQRDNKDQYPQADMQCNCSLPALGSGSDRDEPKDEQESVMPIVVTYESSGLEVYIECFGIPTLFLLDSGCYWSSITRKQLKLWGLQPEAYPNN